MNDQSQSDIKQLLISVSRLEARFDAHLDELRRQGQTNQKILLKHAEEIRGLREWRVAKGTEIDALAQDYKEYKETSSDNAKTTKRRIYQLGVGLVLTLVGLSFEPDGKTILDLFKILSGMG